MASPLQKTLKISDAPLRARLFRPHGEPKKDFEWIECMQFFCAIGFGLPPVRYALCIGGNGFFGCKSSGGMKSVCGACIART